MLKINAGAMLADSDDIALAVVVIHYSNITRTSTYVGAKRRSIRP